MIQLRGYQKDAVNSIYRYFQKKRGNPLIVVPTGGGKSHIIAQFMKDGYTKSQRFLMVTHVKELIEQNHDKMLQHWPEAPTGIFSAGLNKREVAGITFCGIQSVYKKYRLFGKVDLLLVDEAHLIPKEGEGMYRRFIEDLKSVNPNMKIIGFTATPYRLKGGLLTEGRGKIFTDICYDTDICSLIDQGYLCNLRPKAVTAGINTAGIKTVAGDFHKKSLELAASEGDVVESCVSEIVEQGEQRKSWLIFCCGVTHAEMVQDALRSREITTALITGDTPKDVREIQIRSFKSGRTKALININVLTTGFDAPQTDLIAVLRPTKSTGLYVQMLGRGMRIAPRKKDCLVLDFGGNVYRHGPINKINPARFNMMPGEVAVAPVKECPACETLVFAGLRECSYCGHEFPAPEVTHEATSSTEQIIHRAIADQELAVSGVLFLVHRKPGRPNSLRVEYQLPLGTAKEWVCLEHPGHAGERARFWWKRMTGNDNYPETVLEAIERSDEIRRVSYITIIPEGRYTRVISHRFADRPKDAPA